jgi:hypothetical protein
MAEQMTIYSRTWPQQFLSDYERIGEATWLFLFLIVRADPKTGYFRMPFRRVAEEIGVSVVKLKEWLERLEEEGFLRDESLHGKMVVKMAEKTES